jgi:hypothetical protein
MVFPAEGLMQEDLNWSEIGKFDDEITLPLRIICERKSEAAGANLREKQKTKNVRDREHNEVQKLVRAS